MSTNTTPATHEELERAINTATYKQDFDEINRLMAVEIEEKEEEAPVETESTTEEVTEDKALDASNVASEQVEESKEEATDLTAAASTPAVADNKEKEKPTPDQELNNLRSAAGRVPHLQRRLQELERELRDAKLSRKTEELRSAGSTEQVDASKAVIPDNLKKRIEALKEIDPDLAETLQEMAQTLRHDSVATAASFAKEITDHDRQAQEEAFIQDQYSRLVTEVPYAPQIFQSPEWKQWKENLSPGLRNLAESSYADEVKRALGLFVSEMQARMGNQNGSAAAPNPTAATPVQPDQVATKVQASRDRKLNASPSTTAVAAKQGSVEVDEAALFRQMYADIQKKNHLG